MKNGINVDKLKYDRKLLIISLWGILVAFIITNIITYFTGWNGFGYSVIVVYIVCIVFMAKLFNSMETTYATTYIILSILFPPAYIVAFIHALMKSKKIINSFRLKEV